MAETVKKAKAPSKPRKTTAKAAEHPSAVEVAAMEGGVVTEIRTTETRTTEIRVVSHDEIASLAHRYWAERGYAHGQPELDWYRAEQELRGKAS